MILKALIRFSHICLLLLFGSPVLAGDPHAPQLDVSFLAQPAPIVQYGSRLIAYEMLITNFSNKAYVFDAIEAKAGETQFAFSGASLTAMTIHLGVAAPKEAAALRTIEAGRSAMIFFLLDLGKNNAPSTIEHSLMCLMRTAWRTKSCGHH
jgi:hypothetical protein